MVRPVRNRSARTPSTHWMSLRASTRAPRSYAELSSSSSESSPEPSPQPSPEPTAEPSPQPSPQPSPRPSPKGPPEPSPSPSPEPSPEPSPDPSPAPSSRHSGSGINQYAGQANSRNAVRSRKRTRAPEPDSDGESEASERSSKKSRLEESDQDSDQPRGDDESDVMDSIETSSQDGSQVSVETQLTTEPDDDDRKSEVSDDNGPQDGFRQGIPQRPMVIRESYWPRLRQHYKAARRNSNILLEMQCLACRNLTSYPLSQCPAPVHGNDDYREDCVLLPCGHTMGEDCYTEWINSTDERRVRCPVCRTALFCTQCGDAFAPRTLHSLNNIPQLPLTVPEGGRMPAICNACEFERQFIQLTSAGRPNRVGEPQDSHLRRLFGEAVRTSAATAYRSLPRHRTQNLAAIIWARTFTQMRLRMNQFEAEVWRDWPLVSRQPWMTGMINSQFPFNRSSAAIADGNTGDSDSEDSDISLI